MNKPMKLVLSIFAALLLGAPAYADLKVPPPPQGMLNDFAGKLSPASRQQIETLLESFRDRTGIEVAEVTVPFDDMQGYSIEEYALQLGRQWGVGRDSEKRALVLVVAIKPPDPQGSYHGGTRLEVSRHLEGDIPDILAGELIRKMRNDFTAGRFDQALTTGTQTILATIAERLGISMDGIDASQAARQPVRQSPRTPRRGGGIPFFAIIILAVVVFAIIRAIGGGRGSGGGRGGIGSNWLLWAILFGSGRGGGWGGGGGSSWGGGGDSGGGGFGGFGGGGDFGGGGGSDSW